MCPFLPGAAEGESRDFSPRAARVQWDEERKIRIVVAKSGQVKSARAKEMSNERW